MHPRVTTVCVPIRFRPARLACVCVPTTSGTGSEATRTAVLSDAAHAKVWLWGDALKADAILLDPALTVGLPPHLTAATGIDALVHAIEASTNRNANAANDLYCHEAIRLVVKYLARAVNTPADLAARAGLQWAATFAGIGIDNCGTAIAHNIGHALASLRPVHHGRAVGVALRATLPWSVADGDPAYAAAAAAMGETADAQRCCPARSNACCARSGSRCRSAAKGTIRLPRRSWPSRWRCPPTSRCAVRTVVACAIRICSNLPSPYWSLHERAGHARNRRSWQDYCPQSQARGPRLHRRPPDRRRSRARASRTSARSTASSSAAVARCGAADVDAAVAAARAHLRERSLARTEPQGAQARAAALRRADPRRSRAPGAARDARCRQADRQLASRRRRQLRRLHRVLRRVRRQALRRGRAHGPERPGAGAARAARRDRRHRAVELPAHHQLLEGGPGAAHRQFGGAQARRAVAADGDPAGRAGLRGGPAAGRLQRRARASARKPARRWRCTRTSTWSPSPARPRSGG